MDLNLIWIEIGVLKNKKNSRNELARPVMGTIFLKVVYSQYGNQEILLYEYEI